MTTQRITGIPSVQRFGQCQQKNSPRFQAWQRIQVKIVEADDPLGRFLFGKDLPGMWKGGRKLGGFSILVPGFVANWLERRHASKSNNG